MKGSLSEYSEKVIDLRIAFQVVELHPWTAREIAEELLVQIGHLGVALLVSEGKDAPLEANRGIDSIQDEVADVAFHLLALGIYSGVNAGDLNSLSVTSFPESKAHGYFQLAALAGQILECVMSVLGVKLPLERPGYDSEEIFLRDRVRRAIALLCWISTDLGVELNAALDNMFEDAGRFLQKHTQERDKLLLSPQSELAERLRSRLSKAQ
ncbi:hypothetical protein I6F07_17290 [Ensifer sp. IC4062]|nr:hypothetical protein [Ensifer sp. IC4062]MCA1441936.1 hypothetical protein [Ensifer sp. IC4062]